MITVDFNGTTGHLAACDTCGWESRLHTNPDHAFKTGLAHHCKGTK